MAGIEESRQRELQEQFIVKRTGALCELLPRGQGLALNELEQRGVKSFVEDMWHLLHGQDLSPVLAMPAVGEGRSYYYLFSDQLAVVVNQSLTASEQNGELSYCSSDMYALRVRLVGELDEQLAERSWRQPGVNCSFIYFGGGLDYRVALHPEQPVSSVSLLFSPAQLKEKLGVGGVDLMAKLHSLDGQETPSAHIVFLPASAEIMHLAAQIIALEPREQLSALAAEGLSLQLLAHGLNALQRGLALEGGPSRLREVDIQKLMAVKNLLEQDLERQWTIAELSRWAGVNRRKLMEGFKSLFGSTINDYALFQRITRARALLAQGLGVADIATSVGYQDATSFSRAFKRHTGLAPREYKRSVD